MGKGNVIGQTITGHQLDAAAILLEMRNAVGLEQYLDEGVLARVQPRSGMRNPVLTEFDLADLQARDSRIVDLSLEGRRAEWINVEMTAKFRQHIGPHLDLLVGSQSGGAKRTDGICHDPTTCVNRDQNMTVRHVTVRHVRRSVTGEAMFASFSEQVALEYPSNNPRT